MKRVTELGFVDFDINAKLGRTSPKNRLGGVVAGRPLRFEHIPQGVLPKAPVVLGKALKSRLVLIFWLRPNFTWYMIQLTPCQVSKPIT